MQRRPHDIISKLLYEYEDAMWSITPPDALEDIEPPNVGLMIDWVIGSEVPDE